MGKITLELSVPLQELFLSERKNLRHQLWKAIVRSEYVQTIIDIDSINKVFAYACDCEMEK